MVEMGFWPFGRDPADIELVSRVITAATRNGYRVRGKLTIHFVEPQRQAEADEAGDRCAALAVSLLRDAPDHERVIGAEAQLSAELTARYPHSAAPARAVELAALHVLGDPALSDELRRASGTMPAVIPPLSQSSSPPSAARPPPSSNPPVHHGGSAGSADSAGSAPKPPASPAARPGGSSAPTAASPAPTSMDDGGSARSRPQSPVAAHPPTPAQRTGTAQPPGPPHADDGGLLARTPNPQPPPKPLVRRRPSSQIRSIQSLLMPPGTSPAAMGQFVAPMVKDSAARILIGFLRAHDLITVRRVAVDETSAEMLATLVPASDAPPGGYEASRAGEIARWQAALGQGPMFALHHEVRVHAAYLTREALARVEVMPALADAVVEAVCAAAFPDEAGLLAEIAKLPTPPPADFVAQLARALGRIAGGDDDPASLAAALDPLLATVQEDLSVSAMIIKQSSGG
jgi:hypothetical protein